MSSSESLPPATASIWRSAPQSSRDYLLRLRNAKAHLPQIKACFSEGATKICSVGDISPCQRPAPPDNCGDLVGRIRSASAGAEGATAPETLRQKDQQGADGTLERSVLETLAEGITISGTGTEGAQRQGATAPSDLSPRLESAQTPEASFGRYCCPQENTASRPASVARRPHGALRRLRHAGAISGRRHEGASADPRRRRPVRCLPYGPGHRSRRSPAHTRMRRSRSKASCRSISSASPKAASATASSPTTTAAFSTT